MDTALDYRGDLKQDENGQPFLIGGEEELWQKVYVLLSAKKGQFVYDRSLGSEIWKNSTDTAKIVASAREALQQIPLAEVETAEILADGAVAVGVNLRGQSRNIKMKI